MIFRGDYVTVKLFEKRNGGKRFEKDSDNFYRMYMLFLRVGNIVSGVAFVQFG